jgi:hypothetical protein
MLQLSYKRGQAQEHRQDGKGVQHDGLRAGNLFLARQAGPFEAESLRQLRRQPFHLHHGRAGALAGAALPLMRIDG